MRKKKLHVFFGIFAALIVCTILSTGIQRQMIVKVQMGNPSDLSSGAELPTYSSNILSDGQLYEAKKSSQWSSGLQASVVQMEFYDAEEGKVILSTNIGTNLILYRTKELAPGAIVEKTSVRAGEESQYLILAEGKEPELRLAAGKKPFMENLQKEEFGLSAEDKVYSIADIEQFYEQLPLIAALVVMLVLTLMTWIYGWKVRGKRLLITYFVIGCLLFGMHQIVQVIELPSSLLPRTNIFEWSYYKMEWEEIMGALQNIGNK